jgi:hypothetical protein
MPACVVSGCGKAAPFGFRIGGKVEDYCARHRQVGESRFAALASSAFAKASADEPARDPGKLL